MNKIFLILPVIAVLFLGSSLISSASAAPFQSGGVDVEGAWYSGEGLKQGDFFSYSMCHVDYKECSNFELDMWIKGDRQIGSERQWVTEVVVYDGNKRVVGELLLGKIAAEPTGGSEELGLYRGAFKSSVAWLAAFATSDDSSGGKGPKEFKSISWGKIGNIGGEQVIPMAVETITVPAGTWETVQVGWHTGGTVNKVWIVDDFPFPIKARTYTHVSEGIPPTEYDFKLLDYKENVQESPFLDIVSTVDEFAAAGCDTNFEKEASLKKPTHNFDYQIHLFYGPEDPVEGCEMQWLIKFMSKYDDTEFLNQVQFDILVVDDKFTLPPLRSLAEEEGRKFLYSPSGQFIIDMIVREDPGYPNYVLWIYGLAPDGIVPSGASDYLEIPILIYSADDTFSQSIPDWIKTNAGWWADGSIDDDSFVQGIQFLIQERILKIPQPTQGSGSNTGGGIPDWIKTNAGWWADGSIDDDSFVQGIQFLIKEGIMKVPQATQSSSSSGSEPEAWYQ